MNMIANNPVGRPRSFDEEQVLATVMGVFWRKGYEGTSVADLLKATGLHKGSIYQTFGDKHSLFIRALDSYIADMKKNMAEVVATSNSALEALRGISYYHIENGLTEDGVHSGCLALNSLVETAQHDPEVMQVLGSVYKMRIDLVTATVKRAQEAGDLRRDWKPERIAHLIAASEAGILVELKGQLDEKGAKALVDDLLETLN